MLFAAKPIYCGPSVTKLTRAYYVFSPHLRKRILEFFFTLLIAKLSFARRIIFLFSGFYLGARKNE